MEWGEEFLETKVKGFRTVCASLTNRLENNSNAAAEDVGYKANYKF